MATYSFQFETVALDSLNRNILVVNGDNYNVHIDEFIFSQGRPGRQGPQGAPGEKGSRVSVMNKPFRICLPGWSFK